MYRRLSQLLDPFSPDKFFGHFHNRTHLHIVRDRAGFYDKVLSLEDLDACLQSELLPAIFFKVVNDGASKPVDEWSHLRSLESRPTAFSQLPVPVGIPERLFDLYTRGSTIVVNSSDLMIPALLQTCRELTRELGFRVWANIYLTPPEAQGFARHQDKHDVMVLQISGCKSWLLYAEPGSDPVEIEMRPGDLLFIPRGLGHEARCSGRGSIHVTVGMLPLYGFRLLEVLAEAAQGHPLFQQPVPQEFATEEAREAFDRDFAGRLGILFAEMPASALVERGRREFIDTQRSGWRGRFADTLRLQELTGDTVLCSRYEILRRIEDHGDSLEVQFAGNRTTVPTFLKDCLDRVLNDAPFTIREIPGLLTMAGKVDFVRPFVANGLLSIIRI